MDTDLPRLRQLLAELGVGPGRGNTIQHRELAHALGLSHFTWSKIVNGERGPTRRWESWSDFERDVRRAARAATKARRAGNPPARAGRAA